MIVIMDATAGESAIGSVVKEIEKLGLKVDMSKGVDSVTIGMVGDVSLVDKDKMLMMPGVEKVLPVTEPYKKANRKFHPENSVVRVGKVAIGGEKLCIMAGPCSVESEGQITGIAKGLKASGASILRGGAYKPRTSPYSFQGLEKEGIELLRLASAASGLPIVTEITNTRHVEMFEMCVDIIQIGARNMQNFELLKEVGATSKPILLKRGLSSTVSEWLMSAEYIMSRGNPNVILCERGIRTFEDYTRNTLDLSAVVAAKKLSHLPVVVDPSHATGMYWMVEPLSLAAVAAGADGLIVEVHNDPVHALCDGAQSLTPENFDILMDKMRAMAPLFGRSVEKKIGDGNETVEIGGEI